MSATRLQARGAQKAMAMHVAHRPCWKAEEQRILTCWTAETGRTCRMTNLQRTGWVGGRQARFHIPAFTACLLAAFVSHAACGAANNFLCRPHGLPALAPHCGRPCVRTLGLRGGSSESSSPDPVEPSGPDLVESSGPDLVESSGLHHLGLQSASESDSDSDAFGVELTSVIGFGSFSTVYAGTSRKGESLAVKRVQLQSADDVNFKRLQREIRILSAMDHPNIVRLVRVTEDADCVSLVQERCMGGELYDFVNDFQTFHANGERSWRRSNTTEMLIVTEEHIAKMIRQILLAVEYMHSCGVVHRDLKLEVLSSECVPRAQSAA